MARCDFKYCPDCGAQLDSFCPSDATACSVALLTSEPQHDGGFFPVLHVDHQSFSFGMQVETQAEADWYCAQMRTALERAGCRVRPQNHDNQVSLKSMLMDRPDLGDRALRIAELIRERDELRRWTSVNGVSQLAQERDELRAQLREEQQLHVKTLGERDEARQWESQALVARIQRDEFSKTLGEVREILCDAMPNENAPTSFMAATLVKERDEAQKQLLNLWKP